MLAGMLFLIPFGFAGSWNVQAEAPKRQPSLLAVNTPNRVEFGTVDGSEPLQGVLTLLNVGDKPYRIQPPVPGGVARLRFAYPTNLDLTPGASVDIPFVYDLHGSEGDVDLAVEVATTDPAARMAGTMYHAHVVPKTSVRPYRSAVIGTMDQYATTNAEPLYFEFHSITTGERFVDVQIADPTAPLRFTNLRWLDTGGVTGQVELDGYAFSEPAVKHHPLTGETMVIGKTASGSQNYFFVQWYVRRVQVAFR